MCIDAEDPWADEVNDIDDVDRVFPGMLYTIREWFRLYKVPDGKPENKFALDERFMNAAYAMDIIYETHASWAALMKGDIEPKKLDLKHRASMLETGPGAGMMGEVALTVDGFKRITDERTKSQELAADEAKADMEALPDFQPNQWRRMSMAPQMNGPEDTLEYRIQQTTKKDEKAISLWHDVSLRAPDLPGMQDMELYNFVCEIPKWTRKKYEIATGEGSNPIKQVRVWVSVRCACGRHHDGGGSGGRRHRQRQELAIVQYTTSAPPSHLLPCRTKRRAFSAPSRRATSTSTTAASRGRGRTLGSSTPTPRSAETTTRSTCARSGSGRSGRVWCGR